MNNNLLIVWDEISLEGDGDCSDDVDDDGDERSQVVESRVDLEPVGRGILQRWC